ncbi:phage head closure protein [Bacillus inaquosorum]|uniref:phage head closure protein n=1 Tax=Bacillus inaquosorum TaxID=483913 RepID=UPI00227DF2CB|nr:phage head closure protein [Bacillus inaquosorum]MCY8085118.1 phage head closure protein [Bacillus inaquosorum]MCY8126040.1 phage head closure protein [Bacillus spizizenii]
MNSGELKESVEIYKIEKKKDPVTKLNKETTILLHKLRAKIEQPVGRQFYQAAAAHLEYVTWFKVRYRPQIKAGLKLKHLNDNITYDIETVKPDYKNKSYIYLQCKEVI